jgi:hypothetical protein
MVKTALKQTVNLKKTVQATGKEGSWKMKKDTGKWCDFQKLPWHNTDECHSKQSLVVEIKRQVETNPDSDSNSENTGRRQIIDAETPLPV